ncbi:MAG: amidohydrolase [Actinomycetia bacterium]|nr:amidohydrolase [Actinomycetes bacterium]
MTDLPFPVLPGSNGEYIPDPPTAHDRDVEHAARRALDEAASRAGMDRRRFLQSAAGVATVLATLDLAACSSAGKRAARTTSTSARPGGTYTVPPTTHEVEACAAALSGTEFVFDVHTHHVMPDGPWVKNAPSTVQLVLGMLPTDCSAANRLECASRAAYLHDLLLGSDTTVAMLTDVPNSGPADAPIPFTDALGTQAFANALTRGGASRVLVQNIIAPNAGPLAAHLDEMEANAATKGVAAFKVYTAWGPDGRGFALDDPAIGLPVLQKAHDLGVKVFVSHKGLPLVNFDAAHNTPDDIVAVSRIFPDMQFVVFHGAWNKNHVEGPYDANAPLGIDTFLRALDVHNVPPNSNVWVDLGTVWREVSKRPDEAAHVLGKLLSRAGEDRVLWGTDAIWYGSPQSQIMAFRAFQISVEYQDRYHYPALTDAVKRKVLGLNAANLFGIDAEATRCALAADPIAQAKPAAAELRNDGVLPAAYRPNGPTSRREMLSWLRHSATPWTPA